MVYFLSHLESNHEELGEIDIEEIFLDGLIISNSGNLDPWYADYANYIVSGLLSDDINHYQTKRFLYDMNRYSWDEPYLFRECSDRVIHICVIELEYGQFLRLTTHLYLVAIVVVLERL